jgi:hypothetical protein
VLISKSKRRVKKQMKAKPKLSMMKLHDWEFGEESHVHVSSQRMIDE